MRDNTHTTMVWWNKTNHKQTSSIATPVGGGNSQNLNQRFSLTSHTRKGHLQERPQNNRHSLHLASPTKKGDLQGRLQNNRHSLHLASPTRGGDLHRKSVGFKTLTITCLALALISTITLNIIRTYSINNTRTNALGSSSATTSQGSAATLANDPITIALDIAPITTSTSSSCDPSNPKTICLNPGDGGIAVGGHNITINTNSPSGWYLTAIANSNDGTTNLVNTNDNNKVIPTLPSTATINNAVKLADNTWGIALPYGSWLADGYYNDEADYLSNDQSTLANTVWTSMDYINSLLDDERGIASQTATGPATRHIYYGVRVDNPDKLLAGDYQIKVTYTATAILPPAPELTKLVLNDSVQQNQTSEFAIEGTNLDTVYDVWIDYNDNGVEDANEKATDVTTYPNTSKASTIISFTNPNPTSNTVSPGTYDVYAVGQGGTSQPLTNAFIVQEESICRNGDPSSDCQVDIDDNMIPIAYNEDEDSWQIVTKSEIESTRGSWYDYASKKWANAITLRNDYEGGGVCANSVEGVVASTFVGANSCRGSYDTATYTPLEYAMAVYNGDIPNGGVINDLFDFDRISTENNHGGMILGYWVYIPRYAYEVQRPNAIDRVVTDEYPLPDNWITNSYNSHSIRNEFSIHFEKATDTKKTPAETCNTLNITNPNQMWANGTPTAEAGPDNTNILAKDYRTTCVNESNGAITRTYGSATGTTWATHPAFSWLDNNGNGEELNGLWIGKFETTGKVNAPTIKPNQHANVSEYIGEFYTMARSIGTGTYDPTNNGGNTISGITQNSHNLNKATSHMLKNSEWGAITYLASSKYGAGTNNVSINSAYPSTSADADGPSSRYGITGCGPNNINRSTTKYSSVITSTGETVDLPALSSSHIEDPLACGDVDHSYIGNIGQLASTTNNVYGIYDMPGGAYEYVMGNLTGYDDQSESSSINYTTNPIKPPYVDLYKESPYGNFTSGLSGSTNNPVAWLNTSSEYLWNNDVCTWGTCGGHALHETKQYQSVSIGYQSWGDNYSYFVNSGYRWFLRGGSASIGSYAGLFDSNYNDGHASGAYGFRSVLLATP